MAGSHLNERSRFLFDLLVVVFCFLIIFGGLISEVVFSVLDKFGVGICEFSVVVILTVSFVFTIIGL